MILKRICLLLAFVWGSAAAQAATLDSVVPVVNGPTMTASNAQAIAVPPAFSFFSPTALSLEPQASGLSVLRPVIISVSFGVAPEGFKATSAINGASVLDGTFIEAKASAGTIEALFSTAGGDLAASYGGLFRATFTSAFFNANTLVSQAGVFASDTSLLVEAVNVVPLPAGIWLMFASIGGFAVLRRKSSRVRFVPA